MKKENKEKYYNFFDNFGNTKSDTAWILLICCFTIAYYYNYHLLDSYTFYWSPFNDNYTKFDIWYRVFTQNTPNTIDSYFMYGSLLLFCFTAIILCYIYCIVAKRYKKMATMSLESYIITPQDDGYIFKLKKGEEIDYEFVCEREKEIKNYLNIEEDISFTRIPGTANIRITYVKSI